MAYAFANLGDEEGYLFNLHIVFAVLAMLLLIWRILWGVIGTSHARFRSLVFTPGEIIDYFRSIAAGKGQYFPGHNPGSSLAIWGILLLSGITILSGAGISFLGEISEELHEAVSNLLIIVAVFHIAGVLLATIMHGENFTRSMVTGYKNGSPDDRISSSHLPAAVIMLVFVMGGWIYFMMGYDSLRATFTAPGTDFTLRMGENEGEWGDDDHGYDYDYDDD